VNGNTTRAVTERVVAEARRCGAPGTEVTAATARFGVSIVSTEAENDIAAHAVLDVLSETYIGHDAAILAISFDTALIGARQIVPIPVIGMTEASLHTACVLGRRFGLISFGNASRWMYLDWLRRWAGGVSGAPGPASATSSTPVRRGERIKWRQHRVGVTVSQNMTLTPRGGCLSRRVRWSRATEMASPGEGGIPDCVRLIFSL